MDHVNKSSSDLVIYFRLTFVLKWQVFLSHQNMFTTVNLSSHIESCLFSTCVSSANAKFAILKEADYYLDTMHVYEINVLLSAKSICLKL